MGFKSYSRVCRCTSQVYSCDSFDCKATQLSSLKRHKEYVHDSVRYSCDSCEYKATTQSHLKAHKESIHDGVQYSCDSCNYKATALKSTANKFMMVSYILVIVAILGLLH